MAGRFEHVQPGRRVHALRQRQSRAAQPGGGVGPDQPESPARGDSVDHAVLAGQHVREEVEPVVQGQHLAHRLLGCVPGQEHRLPPDDPPFGERARRVLGAVGALVRRREPDVAQLAQPDGAPGEGAERQVDRLPDGHRRQFHPDPPHARQVQRRLGDGGPGHRPVARPGEPQPGGVRVRPEVRDQRQAPAPGVLRLLAGQFAPDLHPDVEGGPVAQTGHQGILLGSPPCWTRAHPPAEGRKALPTRQDDPGGPERFVLRRSRARPSGPPHRDATRTP